jgi:hypothetical protein
MSSLVKRCRDFCNREVIVMNGFYDVLEGTFAEIILHALLWKPSVIRIHMKSMCLLQQN